MRSILSIIVFALVISACSTTKSKNADQIVVLQNVKEIPTPIENNSNILFDKLNEANKNPTPSPNPNSLNEVEYVVNKIDRNKIKKMPLESQPQEIIRHILQRQSSKERFGRSLKEIKVQVEDRDLNHDGKPERILIAKLFSDASIPVFYIFKSENQKWNACLLELDLGSPGSEPFEVEVLTKPDKIDFDLIKVSEIYGDKEILKDVIYYQMQNGKYEMFECRKVEGLNEKITPCS